MASPDLLRRLLLLVRWPLYAADLGNSSVTNISALHNCRSHYATAISETFTQDEKPRHKNGVKWFTLPPYVASVNGTVLGKELAGRQSELKNDAVNASTTALKWVVRCCPELPRSLVHKLFRLRQVRLWCFHDSSM